MAPQDVEPEELKAETERKGHRTKSVGVVFGNSSQTQTQPHGGFWAAGACCGHTSEGEAMGMKERGSRLGILRPEGHPDVTIRLQLCDNAPMPV